MSMISRNRKKPVPTRLDPIRILLGAHILLNQYSEDCNQLVLYYIAQYLKSSFTAEAEKKKEEIQAQRETTLSMILIFIQFSHIIGIDKRVVKN